MYKVSYIFFTCVKKEENSFSLVNYSFPLHLTVDAAIFGKFLLTTIYYMVEYIITQGTLYGSSKLEFNISIIFTLVTDRQCKQKKWS